MLASGKGPWKRSNTLWLSVLMEKNRFLSQFTIALGSIFWHRKRRNTRSDLEKHNNILEAYELTIVLYKLIMNISYRQTYFYYFCNSVLSFKGSFIYKKKKSFIWLLDYQVASCGGSVWFSQNKQSSLWKYYGKRVAQVLELKS